MGDFVLRNMRSIMSFRKRSRVQEDSDDEQAQGSFHKRHDESMRIWRSAWEDFTSVFNGPLWGPIRHHCADASCCSGHDAKETKRRMSHAVTHLQLRAMPSVPQKATWTKTLPCVVWFVLAMACSQLLQSLWPVAFGQMSVNVAVVAAQFVAADFTDPAQVEQIHWQVVQGSRAKAGLMMVKDPATPVRLLILGLVVEVTMSLTRWFMHRAAPSTRFRPSQRACALVDFVNLVASPVTKALQALSAMLSGQAQRLRLLWMRNGGASWEEWCSSHPAELRELRHVVTLAASWIHRRFWHGGMSWPWRLALFVDERLTLEVRRSFAEQFMAMPPDALDEHCSRRLRARLSSVEDFFAPEMQIALRRWAWSVRLSIAPVEWTHGRNRRRTDHSMTWAGFVAQYLNQDLVCRGTPIHPGPPRSTPHTSPSDLYLGISSLLGFG